ncbi:MAG: IS1182 family transposase [Candidatus Omnitrophica bacterium]|nr:IS1182 family transposase [Candidatus Omnitrophota bacterium]
MLGKPNKQKDFFDNYVYENLLPSEHILLDIKREIDFSFVEEETKDLYSSRLGRPGYPPEVLFKMLFLEFYYNLSDVEAAKQCKYNILYRYFIGLQIHEPTPDDTSLVVFRDRLGRERFDRLFDRIVLQAKEKDLLKERLRIADASKVIADVSLPSKVNLLHQGRKLIIKTISKLNPKRAKELTKKFLRKTRLFTKPSKKELSKERKLTRQFIRSVKGKFTEGMEDTLKKLNSVSWGRKKKDKLASFVDPDARFGRTSLGEKGNFCGYKAHILEDESEIITSVDTLKGNEIECTKLGALLDKEEEKRLKTSAVAADSIYDSGDNYRLLGQKKMKAYISFNPRNRRTWQGFKHNEKKGFLTCPQGNTSIGRVPQEDGFLYYFSTRDCQRCPSKATCIKPKETRARVFVRADYVFTGSQNRYRIRALRLRKIIERKFGEAKKWHGMSRARYRGKHKVAIQVLMTFLVMNAKRMARLLKENSPLGAFQPGIAIRAG